jgi:large subunit ribosomal protein L3
MLRDVRCRKKSSRSSGNGKEAEMKKAILATKIGMTQIFKEDGELVPVTVLEAGPCVVTRVKTADSDGYEAVQVGFGDKKDRISVLDKSGKKEVVHQHGVNKAQQGEFKKAGTESRRYLKEFRFDNCADYKVGQEIKADMFAEGDKIDATAISKGRGFVSAIQKGQHRGPMGHGSKFHRHQGSNNSSSDPSRVYKGKVMPGHAGTDQVTVRNLEVVRVDAEKNLILVKGAIPGPKKGLVTIKETTKAEA